MSDTTSRRSTRAIETATLRSKGLRAAKSAYADSAEADSTARAVGDPHLHYYAGADGVTAVRLPFDLEALLDAWGAVRSRMVRRKSDAFTREEWAYLITFLDPTHLRSVFTQAFGAPCDAAEAVPLRWLARPRGPVALWLPNNVSLLGPLTLILLTLTGNPIRVKGGSHAEDLIGALLAYMRDQVPESPLYTLLDQTVRHEVFGRDDPRNDAMAAEARLRIVFGSDESARAIHARPHPLESAGFSFADRRSEAWLEADALSDEGLVALIKVFAIYGQAGCTSPARVVLLDQPPEAARDLRDRLLALWPRAGGRAIAPHFASGNVLARQWAAALGWDAALAPGNQAVLAVGDYDLPAIPAPFLLPIIAAPREEAAAHLPPNIQTLGHLVRDPADPRWLALLARTTIKRFVPVARMHHFGSVWDGYAFWRQAFELVEIGAEP